MAFTIVAADVVPCETRAVGGQPLRGYPPITHGAAAYAMLIDQAGPVNFGYRCFKSLDNGATWTEQDAANAPVIAAQAVGLVSGGLLYDGPGNLLTVAFNDGDNSNANALTFCDFDLSTDSWGAKYMLGVAPNVYNVNQLFVRSNGDLVAITPRHKVGASIQGLTAFVWNGAAWASVNLDTGLSAGESNGASAVVLDAADTLHVFSPVTGGGLVTAMYAQFRADNSVAALTEFTNEFNASGTWSMQKPAIVGGSIYFGVANAAKTDVCLLVGTPLAAPVFSVTAAIDNPGPPFNGFPGGSPGGAPDLSYDGAMLWGTWFYSYIDGALNVVTVVRSIWNAGPDFTMGWAGTDLFITDPATYFSASYPGVYADAAGQWRAVQTTRLADFKRLYLAEFAPAGPAVPLSLSCGNPPNPVVGVAYSHTFPAVGGTPPYVFSLANGVLPPGLALNAGTGEVSGTPTTVGFYPLTVQVVDAALGLALAICGLLVVPGAAALSGLRIMLRGVKRVKAEQNPEPCAAPELPHVKRGSVV